MKTFFTRAISAFIAAAAVYLLHFKWQSHGLKFLPLIAAVVGGYELTKIFFQKKCTMTMRVSFYCSLLMIFILTSIFQNLTGLIFSIISVLFCSLTLLLHKQFSDLTELSVFQARSLMGFFYIGLLPSLAVQTLELSNGSAWFFLLLIIVFSGDIGAYLVGMTFGKNKLMPSVSPKKTREGAISGLMFSIVAGSVSGHLLLNHVPLVQIAIISTLAAAVAQIGDLFESQLKRVSDMKDSGTIMPGHGGILDRIDGILFACPVILYAATIIEGIQT